MEQVAILYRSANDGTRLANAADVAKIPVIRADNKALIPRNKRLARFCEACAQWVCDGWKTAEPSFARLAWDAVSMIYGNDATEDERTAVEAELISFLTSSVKEPCETNEWLKKFNGELIAPWQLRVRGTAEEWDVVDTMIARTDPQSGSDMPLAYLAGKVEGTGCLNLSTLHSAKGREFDAVILYGVNNDAFPAWRDKGKELREARRLFYVGVTRTRKDLYLVYQKKAYSPWVKELYDRVKS
jgi:DNA helicase-2/ATP-dependent DNA helicase PcrA